MRQSDVLTPRGSNQALQINLFQVVLKTETKETNKQTNDPTVARKCQEPTSALNRNLIGKTKKENLVDLILLYDRSWIFSAQLCSMGI